MTEVAHTGTPILYAVFTLLVIELLAVDFLLRRTQGSHKVTMKEEDTRKIRLTIDHCARHRRRGAGKRRRRG